MDFDLYISLYFFSFAKYEVLKKHTQNGENKTSREAQFWNDEYGFLILSILKMTNPMIMVFRKILATSI